MKFNDSPIIKTATFIFGHCFYMIGIYKITSPTNKIYIGQSIDIDRRIYDYSLLRCKAQTILYNSFKKHGFNNHSFEIIEECTIDKLNERERYWQDHYDVLGRKGLNCLLTKTSDKSGRISEEIKEKLRQANIGKKMSKESIEKVRKVHLGRKDSEEVKLRRRLANIGLKRSQSFKDKMRAINLGKKQSKETIEKRFVNSRGANHHSAKLIINTETGIFYETIKEASMSVTHISYKNISRQLKGDRRIINNPFSYA